jgi:DNA processing protein
VSRESRTSPCLEFDRLDVVALTTIERFGPANARAHLERIRAEGREFDDGLPPGAFSAARDTLRRLLARADRCGARFMLDGDPDYPPGLTDLEHPPLVLWVIGELPASDRPTIAIVGTRDCTSYGERVTRSLANAFARCGATVVSGMARGIDAAAHVAAMESGGRTVAVLGTGVDVPYPAAHRGLHARIAKHGAVISETLPGATAIKGCFPRRNRIIAALGAATIVVEAGARSGALNTADWAAGIGRKVAIVPGPIDSPASLGSNLLLRDGAFPIATPEDALALISLSEPGRASVELCSPAERAIWKALEQPAANFDVLCGRVGLPARVCLETVTALELRGIVDCAITGEVRRR